jgi:hypothetical protein
MKRPIKDHISLKEQIHSVEQAIREQEEQLLVQLKKTAVVISDPAPYIKQLTSDLARDKDFRKDLLKLALSAGTNYLGRLLQSPGTVDTLLSAFTAGSKEKGESLPDRLFRFFANKFKSTSSTSRP